jgi:ketosteroid isomerase-like protein
MTRPDVTEDDLRELVARVRDATKTLMQGDVRRYFALVDEAPDYSLMPPTGGPTRHGVDASSATIEALEEFFPGGGDGDLEVEQQYASGDLAVGVERQHGPIGGLPAQEWPLRVTLVFRREAPGWRLVHRHADALVHPITMQLLSRLADVRLRRARHVGSASVQPRLLDPQVARELGITARAPDTSGGYGSASSASNRDGAKATSSIATSCPQPGAASMRVVTTASRPSASTTTSPGSKFGAGCSRRPRSSPVVSWRR